MVIVQVRRRSDVCYPSGVGEPYMSGLSPANFNALQAMINAAHDTTGGKKRIEVHCWSVTFKTGNGDGLLAAQRYAHGQPHRPRQLLADARQQHHRRRERRQGLRPRPSQVPGVPRQRAHGPGELRDDRRARRHRWPHRRHPLRLHPLHGNNQGYNPTSVARYNARYGLTGHPASSNEQFKQWRRDQVTRFVRQVYARDPEEQAVGQAVRLVRHLESLAHRLDPGRVSGHPALLRRLLRLG